MYTPLIDQKPSDPTTMMTAMLEAQHITRLTGQKHTIFTSDQQLYKVLVDIKWALPESFHYFVQRLGGMHLLMSFIGCIGVLTTNSVFQEILQKAFSGVEKMLTGKKFPKNLRALRMVVEELLRDVIANFQRYGDLEAYLRETSLKSKTSKHWVDNLIKPIFIILLFVRAEREAERLLHLLAVRSMLPYFFAAGHHNYARYGLYYLRSMHKLPPEKLERFMKGVHVTRHQRGYWNAIWSDMFIKTTFMRYGKGPGGIVGVTLKPEVVKKWANSLHICTQILMGLDDIRERDTNKEKEFHKEEMPSRIKSDEEDRCVLRDALKSCVNPLNTEIPSLVNIHSGNIAKDSVNVFTSVHIGENQLSEYESSWSDGFYSPIKKVVNTMKVGKKSVKLDEIEVYNTEMIYTRVMCLFSMGRIELEDVLKYHCLYLKIMGR